MNADQVLNKKRQPLPRKRVSRKMIRHGDFTAMARYYIHRAGYSVSLLREAATGLDAFRDGFRFADVGAGTGKLTKNILELGLSGVAVEPNDAMRAAGELFCRTSDRLEWQKGWGEDTGLPAACVDWVLMGSSFHWTDHVQSLPEFHRILRPGGALTMLWNPRDLGKSEWQVKLEKDIKAMIPNFKRRSSGAKPYTGNLERKLRSTGHFNGISFLEADHQVVMTRARYLGVWMSVNDIRVQAGEEKWQKILAMVENRVKDMDEIVAHYKTRAWTARRT